MNNDYPPTRKSMTQNNKSSLPDLCTSNAHIPVMHLYNHTESLSIAAQTSFHCFCNILALSRHLDAPYCAFLYCSLVARPSDSNNTLHTT